MISLLKVQLPPYKKIAPYLAQIDYNHWYSNYGPLSVSLEKRIAAHYKLSSPQCLMTNSATSGLMATLLLLGKKNTHCLMPSWTFAATPQAALMAGMSPYFVDVDDQGFLDINLCYELADKNKIGAVVVVAPFGAPIDYKAWLAFQTKTQIPVIVDAAAGFASALSAALPTVVSLHATKLLGVGEGGFILCPHNDIRKKLQQVINFGFEKGKRSSGMIGFNGKLSEYAAAVGHAGMDALSDTVAVYQKMAQQYKNGLSDIQEIYFQKGFGESWISNTCNISLPAGTREDCQTFLRRKEIETRPLYEKPCHLQVPFKECAKTHMQGTQKKNDTTLALPFHLLLIQENIEKICYSIKSFYYEKSLEDVS